MDFEGWEKATWMLLENRLPGEADRDYTHSEARTIMEAAMQALVDELATGGQLALSNFGRICVTTKNARQMVSNLGGESRVFDLPTRKGICFRPSRVLLDMIN